MEVRKELDQLLASASESTKIFFGMNFLKIYQNEAGYYPKFKGTYNYYNEWTQVYGYDLSDGRFTSLSNDYSLLSPRYLSSVVDAFIKDSDEFDHISVQDMAELILQIIIMMQDKVLPYLPP